MFQKINIDGPSACAAVIRNDSHDVSRFINEGSQVSNYMAFCQLLAEFIEAYGLPTDYRLTLMHNGVNIAQGIAKRQYHVNH